MRRVHAGALQRLPLHLGEGNPGIAGGSVPSAVELDRVLHRERLTPAGGKRTYVASLEELQRLTASIVELAGVRKTTSTFTVSTPIPYRVLPLLKDVTRHAGWGRSTPAPH